MRIIDIQIYRDGGSIEFTIERGGSAKHIWLETPFAGEPRALLINSVPVEYGSVDVTTFLDEIDEWWGALPPSSRQAIDQCLRHKGPYFNATPEESAAIELSRVITVRDYVKDVYLLSPSPVTHQ
jgi:hypothetical protein